MWCHSARSASASHRGTTTYPEHHSQNGELGLESAGKNQAVRRSLSRESGHLPEFQSDNSRDHEVYDFHISLMLSSSYVKFMEARVGIEPANRGFARRSACRAAVSRRDRRSDVFLIIDRVEESPRPDTVSPRLRRVVLQLANARPEVRVLAQLRVDGSPQPAGNLLVTSTVDRL